MCVLQEDLSVGMEPCHKLDTKRKHADDCGLTGI